MICYKDGEKTDARPDGSGGNWLVFGDISSEPGLFSELNLPVEVAAETKDQHFGRFESHDGYDYVMILEPKKGSRHLRKTILFQSAELLFIGFDEAEHMRIISERLGDAAKKADNAMTAVRFFEALTIKDTEILQTFEQQIEELEEQINANSNAKDLNRSIGAQRKKLMRSKRYYEQLLDVISDMMDNENKFLTRPAVKRLKTLSDKFDRSYHNILNMQEYLSQVRDEYETQIDIGLNQTMKVFTVISAVFLPLTLVVGWYGMNFQMPEYGWRFGYPAVIGLSIIITGVCLYIFKKKKWF